MKKLVVYLVTICLVIGICACGKEEIPEIAESVQDTTIQQEGNTTETIVQTESKDSAEEKTSEAESISAEETETEQKTGQMAVYNNGGEFVKVGDTVYFRVYGDDAIAKTALWGKYRGEATGLGNSQLFGYNTKTKQTYVVSDDNGDHEIWYFDGRFYLRRYLPDDYSWEYYSVDGNGADYLEIGMANGFCTFDDKTGRMAVSNYTYDNTDEHLSIAIYEKGQFIRKVVDETWNGLTEVFLDGDNLIVVALLKDDGEEYADKYGLYCVDIDNPDSEMLRLGVVLSNEDGFGDYISRVQYCKIDEEAYFSFSTSGGTGHFFYYQDTYKADLTMEDSIETVEIATGDIDCELEMVAGNGTVTYVEHLPGTAWQEYMVDEVDDGCYYLFAMDESGVIHELYPILEPDFNLEVYEVVDGMVFTVGNYEEYNPEESIGWRDAYTRNKTVYQVVGYDGNRIDTLCTVESEVE